MSASAMANAVMPSTGSTAMFRPKRAAICLRPGGLETVKDVADAVVDAGKSADQVGTEIWGLVVQRLGVA